MKKTRSQKTVYPKNAGRFQASEARDNLSELLSRVAFASERIILERYQKKIAALIPIEDLALLEELEDQIDIEAARQAMKEKKSIPWEKIKADLRNRPKTKINSRK